jgi:hypothetical protein
MKTLEAAVKQTYSEYHSSFKSDLLIKFAICAAELYDLLERAEQSAQYYQRIASEIQGAPMIIALFYEQASLQYLKIRKYRKFCFYQLQAAMNYQAADHPEYALHCYQVVHPFLQSQMGWSSIRFHVYNALGSSPQMHFVGDEVANDFFRNYLQLCQEVPDVNQQKRLIDACKRSIQTWLQKQEGQTMLDVGQSALPLLLDNQ